MNFFNLIRPIIFLLALLATLPLRAQWLMSNLELQLKDTQINPKYTDTLTGQKGIYISLNYSYKPPKNKLLSSQLKLKLSYKGEMVYADSSQIWLFNPKKSRPLSAFIPFSKIKLEAGDYTQVNLEAELPQVAKMYTTVDFVQMQRFKADIVLEMGEIKRQLREYDPKESPKNWLPDPYIGIYTPNASQPIYKTRVFENTYLVEKQLLSCFLLANSPLELRVYDEDGEEDLLLGKIALPNCVGDASFDYSGQMFDDCKGFFYQVNYQQLILQPINLSAQVYDYQNTKGVLLTAKYDLAKAYTSKKSRLNFIFKDKNGNNLSTKDIIPLAAAPRLDSFIQPNTRGEWQYFVPFYAWRNNSHAISLQLSPEVGEGINSTPCILPQPIIFDNPLRMAKIYTQDNVSFQQVKGVFVNVEYELNTDLQSYEQLRVGFKSENNNLQVYKIDGEKYQTALPQYSQKNVPAKSNLQFFIPYAGMAKVENLSLSCQTKANNSPKVIDIVADTNLILRAQNSKDAVLTLQKIDDYVINGDYGKQFFIQSKVPFFLKNRIQLKISAYKNGEVFTEYRPFKLVENGFLVTADNGALLFPYRFWQGKDSLSFQMVAVDAQGNELSEVLSYQYRLPEVINTVQMRVEISKVKINPKKLPKDSSQTALGKWQLWVGGDNVHSFELPALANMPKSLLKKQQFVFWAHREDKLAQKIAQSNDTTNLWYADWGKIQQADYLQIVKKKSLIARAHIWILPEAVAKSPIKKFFFKAYHRSAKLFTKKKQKRR